MNRKAGAVLAWLPVLGVVAVMFGAPSEGAARASSLDVTPGAGQYGGTPAHFVGDLNYTSGSPQAIHLQRRGSTTSAWADVENSNVGSTDARGHFDFWFPSPAMNSVYFRVVSARGQSPDHHFTSKHQDADLRVSEVAPPPGVPPLEETIAEGIAVRGEGFTFKIDTTHGAAGETKPALPGRVVTLQRRTAAGTWLNLPPAATLPRDGVLVLDGPTNLQQSGDYRVRMEKFTPPNAGQCVGQQPCEIGEFFTFPYDLEVVDRPVAPARLTATAESPTTIKLTWFLPAGAADNVYVVQGSGFRKGGKVLPGDATTYTDTGLFGGLTYTYSVFACKTVARSQCDPVQNAGVYGGVYSLDTAHASATTPGPKQRGVR